MMRKLASMLLLLPFANECHASLVEVVGGDKVLIDGQLAHLADIDAPESCQPGGEESQAALTTFLHGDLTFQTVGVDEDGLQQIRLYSEGREINQLLVQEGWARDATRSRPSRYSFAEAVAKMEGIGIWSFGHDEAHPLSDNDSCS